MSDAFQDCPIAAIATAMGSAGICVVRISGAGSLELGDCLVSSARQKPSQRVSGTFCYAKIVHPMTHQIIDDVLLLVFRAPHSYTGEDTLEIQGHGGTFSAQRLLDAVLNAGARLAAPGEFTKRAFLNGRLDLTQAEAVCDFIQAKTERAAHAARVQLDGVLGKRIDALYVRVTNLCAEVEHWLDFDEGELPISFGETIHRNVKVLAGELSELIDSWNASRFLRDGAVVVISGRPNAGKSSLMNALLGRNRAIVYEEPGTTRDVIEDVLSLKGIPIRLVDTAGLRSTENAIEREGIARARDAMEHADLNLYLIDQSVAVSTEDADALKNLPHESTVVVLTKNDLPHRFDLKAANRFDKVCISTVARTGLESLQSVILKKLGVTYESETVPVVSVRHVTELRQAVASLRQSDRLIDEGSDRLVIVANLLREAAEALGRIVGRVYSDDLLDTIFGRFCVGK